MAEEFGLGVMMYSPLAGGLLTGKYRNGEAGRISLSTQSNYSEDQKTNEVIDELLAVKYDKFFEPLILIEKPIYKHMNVT